MRKGFTLIELIITITIIGILGALIVPRFAKLDRNARIAAVSAMYGSLSSGAAITYVNVVGKKQEGAPTTDLEGATITLVNNFPSATDTGINNAINYPTAIVTGSIPGYKVWAISSTVVYRPDSASSSLTGASLTAGADCGVSYTEAAPGQRPTIIEVTDSC